MITVADVLKKLDDQLAWRGPGGRTMGHVVLDRDEGERLRDGVIEIIKERDALVEHAHRPHAYMASVLHMGDCAVCGHPQHDQIHEDQHPACPVCGTHDRAAFLRCPRLDCLRWGELK